MSNSLFFVSTIHADIIRKKLESLAKDKTKIIKEEVSARYTNDTIFQVKCPTSMNQYIQGYIDAVEEHSVRERKPDDGYEYSTPDMGVSFPPKDDETKENEPEKEPDNATATGTGAESPAQQDPDGFCVDRTSGSPGWGA